MLTGMPPSDHRDRIIQVLQQASHPLDDDELARRAGISPRQTVNRLGRALANAGVVRRYPGPDGKIVSELITAQNSSDDQDTGSGRPPGPAIAAAAAILVPAGDHAIPPGSSREQRDAERVMLDILGQRMGLSLEPATITVPSGARIEVDGADSGRTVLVECWAHQGPPKSAQRHKVLADAFKLTWISRTMSPPPRLVLCLTDPLAAAPFTPGGRSWAAQALHDLSITIELIDLPPDTRQALLTAQRRQYR